MACLLHTSLQALLKYCTVGHSAGGDKVQLAVLRRSNTPYMGIPNPILYKCKYKHPRGYLILGGRHQLNSIEMRGFEINEVRPAVLQGESHPHWPNRPRKVGRAPFISIWPAMVAGRSLRDWCRTHDIAFQGAGWKIDASFGDFSTFGEKLYCTYLRLPPILQATLDF